MSIAPGYRGTNTIMQEMEARMGKFTTLSGQSGERHTSEQKNTMATVRAKFRLDNYTTSLCQRKIDPKGSWEAKNLRSEEVRTLVFQPVYGNGDPNHENTKFWEASPSGKLELGVVNQDAWKHFELGKEYYLDFTLAE